MRIKPVNRDGKTIEEVLNEFIKDPAHLIETGELSDGYHTFDELYEHRIRLYITLLKTIRGLELSTRVVGSMLVEPSGDSAIWMSRLHHDGTEFNGWFILGIFGDKGKQISYHLPMTKWQECIEFAIVLDKAPEWDGHTSSDVLDRLKALI